jgi:hypothetical protein
MYGDGSDFLKLNLKSSKLEYKTFEDIIIIEGNGTGSY